MAISEKEILEALSSTRILTAMITPAVLISACGTLIFSTSARLGRVFDRVNVLKSELEAVISGSSSYPEERLSFLKDQVALQRTRATLIHHAMSALYTATGSFVAASLAIALTMVYGKNDYAWIPTLLALAGGLFLLYASILLIYEGRHNLRFVYRHLDFIEFLQAKAITPHETDPP
jgi:divalent metal cation (Fe/Co/Zn/Cd) transporter